MKIICAWCKKVIIDGHEPISHGICPECLKHELRKIEKENAGDDLSGMREAPQKG